MSVSVACEHPGCIYARHDTGLGVSAGVVETVWLPSFLWAEACAAVGMVNAGHHRANWTLDHAKYTFYCLLLSPTACYCLLPSTDT